MLQAHLMTPTQLRSDSPSVLRTICHRRNLVLILHRFSGLFATSKVDPEIFESAGSLRHLDVPSRSIQHPSQDQFATVDRPFFKHNMFCFPDDEVRMLVMCLNHTSLESRERIDEHLSIISIKSVIRIQTYRNNAVTSLFGIQKPYRHQSSSAQHLALSQPVV